MKQIIKIRENYLICVLLISTVIIHVKRRSKLKRLLGKGGGGLGGWGGGYAHNIQSHSHANRSSSLSSPLWLQGEVGMKYWSICEREQPCTAQMTNILFTLCRQNRITRLSDFPRYIFYIFPKVHNNEYFFLVFFQFGTETY